MACSAAKKGGGVDGICGSIAYDTDPDNDCPYGACDGKNQCKNYNGFTCASAAQCLSNYCVDGYCCGNICMGACQACSMAKKGGGSNGVCGNVAVNTDPDNECNPGECNGAGTCNASPQPKSANGAACSSAAQCSSGYCADGVCCDSWCLGTCQACTAAKKNQGVDGVCGPVANDKDADDECWGGACNGAGVCKQYNGVPCVDKAQCLSGYCVDGFCCGNICTGMCYACSEARKGQGYDGVCGPIASGRDPDSECNPGECGGAGACNQPQTPQVNGTVCASSGQCASGNCVDGVCCDTACAGLCSACTASKKGQGANGTCGPIVAETDPENECGVGGRCGGNGTCKYYNGATCSAGAQCFSNYCIDGVCCGNVCTSTCYACSAVKKGQGSDGACGPIANTRDPDNECNPGECNGSGACNQSQVLLANGAACTLATQCSSGFCSDGVCCDKACSGLCEACSATKKGSGSNGTCGNIKYDADPDNECASGACSGMGTCQFYNGVACSGTSECLSHYCVDGYCCGNVCNLPCVACSSAKKGSGTNGVCGNIAPNTDPDNECGLDCNGTGACLAVGNGASCTTNANCASGFCVDGVCCNSACSANCEACNMPGTEGTCKSSCTPACGSGNVALGQAPIGPTASILSGRSVTTADFNGDGIQDVAAGSDNKIRVYLRQNMSALPAGVDYPVNGISNAMVAADLNGDGLQDIVSVNDGNEIWSAYINQGNGTFTTVVNATAGNLKNLAVGDVNGDSFPDLVTVGTGSGLSVALNQGNGSFVYSSGYSTNAYLPAAAVADLNGDGKLDIVAAGRWFYDVFLNQGNGTFAAAVSRPLRDFNYPQSVVATDLNADGITDVAIAYSDYNYVDIAMGQGNAAFAAIVSYPLCDQGGALRVAEITGDTYPDLVIGSNGDGLSALRNLGNGTFTGIGCFPAGAGARAISLSDMNGDGRVDVTTVGNSTFAIVPNLGGGVFGGTPSVPVYATAASPQKIFTGDLNGDGKADLVTGNANISASVLLGQGNGTFAAKVDYSSGALVGLADMNGDGKPDIVDADGADFGVLYNQGNGTFGARTIAHAGTGYVNVVAELNGDAFADVAYLTYVASVDIGPNSLSPSENKLILGFNQGNGTFVDVVTDFGGVPFTQFQPSSNALVTSDVNGDGRTDLVYALGETDNVFVRLHDNTNSGAGLNYHFSGAGPYSVIAADLTGDGRTDIGVDPYWGYAGYMYSLKNNNYSGNNGLFFGSTWYADGFFTATQADFNGDGATEIATPAYLSVRIVSSLSNGSWPFSGGFLKNWYYGTGTLPKAIVAADFNGDGRPDLATANTSTNNVSILLNSCLP